MGKLIGSIVLLGLLIYLATSYFRGEDRPDTASNIENSQIQSNRFEQKDNTGHNIPKNYFSMPGTVNEESIEIPEEDPYDFYSREVERKDKP